MHFKISDAELKQVAEIHMLEKQCFSMPWTEYQIRSQLGDSEHIFLVALSDDDSVLGYIGMMFVLDEGYISNVAVAPDARGQGIAKALIAELLTRAGEKQLSFLTLEVRESNTAAKKLYLGCGFEPVGIRKNYYELPKEDAILMTLYLK